jgi:hypothetical protein
MGRDPDSVRDGDSDSDGVYYLSVEDFEASAPPSKRGDNRDSSVTPESEAKREEPS